MKLSETEHGLCWFHLQRTRESLSTQSLKYRPQPLSVKVAASFLPFSKLRNFPGLVAAGDPPRTAQAAITQRWCLILPDSLDAVSTPLSPGLFGDALPLQQGGGRNRAFPTAAKKANGYISFPKAGKLFLLPADPSTTKNTIKQQECVKNKHRHASAFRIPVPRARGAQAADRRNVVLHREP